METTTATVAIQTADGSMPAFVARPTGEGKFAAIVVVQEAFGLNAHIKEVTERIARQGNVALAPDLYHRENSPVVGYDNLPEAIRLMMGLWDDKIVQDMGRAISYLQEQPSVYPDRIGVTGFCMGGRVTFLTACMNRAVTAAAAFYGGGIGSVMQPSERTPKAPLEYAAQLTAPVLLLFGGDDAFISPAEVEKIKQRLTDLGKPAEVVVYPEAPHGFFCNERESYRAEAANDAWERLGKFFHQHLHG